MIAATTQASTSAIVTQEATTDYILRGAAQGTVPEQAVADVRALPGVRAADTFATAGVLVGDSTFAVTGIDPTAVGRSIRTEVVEGEFPGALAAGEVAVQRTTMDDEDWSLGQELTLVGSSGADTLTIGAVIDSPAFGVPFVVSQTVLDSLFAPDEQRLTTVFVTAAEGADVAALRGELTAAVRPLRRGVGDGQRRVRLRPRRAGGPRARDPLRAAGPVGRHRRARHRQHARPVGHRADPGRSGCSARSGWAVCSWARRSRWSRSSPRCSARRWGW
ncbi:hypothetical protein [Cellulomonas sp.]|uniref:hypothetical protein n=1 Tax=Cellulomonas sp. TaxID=40001 RepID=UPI003BAC868E